MLVAFLASSYALAQTKKPEWDIRSLKSPPKWAILERPTQSSSNVKPVFFTALPLTERYIIQ